MSYKHISIEERRFLYKLRVKKRLSLSTISQIMGRNKSTISRELNRNTYEKYGYYWPDTAQKKMEDRRQQAKSKFYSINFNTLKEIKKRLRSHHSPQQISGRMKREGMATVSYETIYQMIYHNYQGFGDFRLFLRQKQKYRRRKGLIQNRGKIPNRISIENRPKIADLKQEKGHWESDTMIGRHHAGAIVTHVDKASKFLITGLCLNKKSEQINEVTINLFEKLDKKTRKTMTFDNGKEFSGHEEISKKLGLKCFFANPYSSWERGLNEHTNGLIREFFPKKTDFTKIKEKHLQRVTQIINNRPRKSLDYHTPYEVFYDIR